ncbi:M23 family metallopeptidase [uncultured Microbacterium sp.]|uniref:M23 family metallopeptidase n=1 Tax=uncultured Microbacterium sp. TaxID=191216 RepID=UPI0025944491|nr:M23 family metallopeptidase [uncultured Microbacterium sp.]
MAEAVPTRRPSRRASAPAAPEETGVPLTRAELRRRAAAAQAAPSSVDAPSADAAIGVEQVAPFVAGISVAEAVVADVAAAIIGETVGTEPDAASRRRLREATEAVFAHVAESEAATPERVAEPAPEASTSAFVNPEPCHLDEFEFAARLFSFTGETPVQRTAASTADEGAETAAPVAASTVHLTARRPRRGRVVFQRVAAASFSIGVMTIVGMLAVATTTPAAAVASASSALTTDISASAKGAAKKSDGTVQAFVTSGATDATALDRPEEYNVASMSEIAADSGVTIFAGTWVNNPSAPIQWPFPVGVPVSAAYGSSSYLAEFSSAHSGVDLTPGEGAEVHAVAAGTVRIATESGGDYGVTVLIDHVIDGQVVSTRYGHMQYGSLQVSQGEKVTAGQVIGKVGQTGKSTGPHLHLEVLLGGTTTTDPMPWLAEHTTGTHTVG